MRISLLLLLALLVAGPALGQDPTSRPWLGVYLDTDRGSSGVEEGEVRPAAVIIRRVVQEGPAAEAGLRARDRVRAVDGVPVSSTDDLISRLGKYGPGTWVTLDVERGEREIQLRLRLGDRPERVSGLAVREGWIGIAAIDLTPSLRLHFGAPEEAGVMVAEIEPGSPGEAAGLQLGDVLFEVEGEAVPSSRELARLIAGGGVGNSLEIRVARYGAEIVIEADVLEAPPADDDAR
jgi:S1-C subfamily serine protease